MAYQNVGTPRFYVDVLQWYHSLGLGYPEDIDYNIFNLNPSNPSPPTASRQFTFSSTAHLYNINYFAFLGHDVGADNAINGKFVDENDPYLNYISNMDVIDGVNIDQIGLNATSYTFTYNGFSLAILPLAGYEVTAASYFYISSDSLIPHNIGAFSIGTYYEMPHSPDLNLTMTREYGGIKTIETKGGATLTNSFYNKPSPWGNLGAWEMSNNSSSYTANRAFTKSGRRVWDLSFSYLQDSDVFGSNQTYGNLHPTQTFWYPGGLTEGTTTGYEDDDISSSGFTYNILTDDNFYSQVIHKTNGGQLPFIFQPDGSNNNPDQFAIAKFDMNSFKFSQKSFNTYNISLKIREVW